MLTSKYFSLQIYLYINSCILSLRLNTLELIYEFVPNRFLSQNIPIPVQRPKPIPRFVEIPNSCQISLDMTTGLETVLEMKLWWDSNEKCWKWNCDETVMRSAGNETVMRQQWEVLEMKLWWDSNEKCWKWNCDETAMRSAGNETVMRQQWEVLEMKLWWDSNEKCWKWNCDETAMRSAGNETVMRQ